MRFAFLVAAVSLSFGACSGDGGPVVPMYHGEPNGDDAALPGKLEIDGECLYVVSPDGSRTQIAFPTESADWDAGEHRITLSRGSARVGEPVIFGGSAHPLSRASAFEWKTKPRKVCAGDWIWIAGDSVRLDTP